MTRIAYFLDPSGHLGEAMTDLIAAIDGASMAKDRAAAQLLRSFVLSHVEGRLATKSTAQMERYLARRAPWKETDYWNVYRLPDTPSMSYAARLDEEGEIDLVVLGFVYRYPEGDPEIWWSQTLQQRVNSLTRIRTN